MHPRQKEINLARAKVAVRHGRVLRIIGWDLGIEGSAVSFGIQEREMAFWNRRVDRELGVPLGNAVGAHEREAR